MAAESKTPIFRECRGVPSCLPRPLWIGLVAGLLIFVLALNNFAVPAILQTKVFPAEIVERHADRQHRQSEPPLNGEGVE